MFNTRNPKYEICQSWNASETDRRNNVIQLLREELGEEPTTANPGPSKASTIDLVTDDDQVD